MQRFNLHHGFTLIELLCGLAVTGILSSIAYPAYQGTIAKARRTDAHVALMLLQGAQERRRSSQPTYGSLADIGVAATSPSRHYAVSVASITADGYEALAMASGLQRADVPCRHLKMVVNGAQVVYASGPDSRAGNDAAKNRQCWGGR